MLRTGVPVCTMKGNDYIGRHESSLVNNAISKAHELVYTKLYNDRFVICDD